MNNDSQLNDIINSFTDSVEVSEETIINRLDYHSSLYKNKSHHFENQEKRRNEFFECQKKKRSDLKMQSRNFTSILQDDDNDSSSSSMEWSNQPSNVNKLKGRKLLNNKLMLSEWLVEVPPDLSTNWLLVVCPVGKRCLVMSKKGKTRVYTRSGHHFRTISSCLSGGNRECSRKYKDSSILDCIFVESERTFYILDLIEWNDVWFYDAETDFRFFWLESRVKPELIEVTETLKHSSFGYNFIPLSHYSCDKESIRKAVVDGSKQFKSQEQIDGLLFFHRKSHYTPGVTPLVCWLKPSMLSQVLDIDLASTETECTKMEDST